MAANPATIILLVFMMLSFGLIYRSDISAHILTMKYVTLAHDKSSTRELKKVMNISWSPFLIIPIFIGLCFVIVFGGIIYVSVRAIPQVSYNGFQSVEIVVETIVGKRTSTWGGGADCMSTTSNYVTSETEDGVRRQLSLGGSEYGLLVEGDKGMLSSQGSHYKGFHREHL